MRISLIIALFISMIWASSSTALADDLQVSKNPPVVVADGWKLSGHSDIAFGRVFQEQGVQYAPTKYGDSVSDIVLTKNNCGADVFLAESLAGRAQDREEDLILFCNFKLRYGFTVQVNTAYDELEPQGEYRQRLVLSHQLTKSCVGNAYADLLRGAPLDSEVYKGEAVCTPQITRNIALSALLQVSYDRHFGRTNFGYDVGILIPVGHVWGHAVFLRPYTKGYEVLSNDRHIYGVNGQIFGAGFVFH